ncbi:MAG: ATP-binding protein [Scytolyngbya sp. HA4215-MV1]|nr:ATP-binding protein [Scytolyngbya sp. HA4215-MV1]
MGYFDTSETAGNSHKLQSLSLLAAGWRPLYRELDWDFLNNLMLNDTQELTQKTLNLMGNLANAVGRNQYTWWANLLNLFSENTRYDLDEFWEYITPDPPYPDFRYQESLSAEVPAPRSIDRNMIAIDIVLHQLRELTILRVLDCLGCPDLVMQYYLDRYFYLPPQKFAGWKRLDVVNTVQACWQQPDVWLQIETFDRGKRLYTLMAKELAPWVSKATYNLAVMLSGYQSRVGQVNAEYPIRSFPRDVQDFSDAVQQAIFDQQRLAVLVSGKPGTGKTAWTQAIAKEILVPLGYVIFILDHDAVEHFVPPSYLERICLIINEADNLAQDRATLAAQSNTRTEHILSLLDGTLYQSVVDLIGNQTRQRLVVLMTCNTVDRLDPAMLRKGRVDLTCEFTHCFV